MLKRFASDILCCLLLAGLALAVAVPAYRCNFEPHDEGFLAHGADRVLQGQVPHRDFFSYQPPGSFYAVGMVFTLFGESLIALRAAGVGVAVAIVLLVYMLSRQFAGALIALAAAIPATAIGMRYFYYVPFAAWQGVLACLLAAFCVLRSGATGGRGWAFAAGLATAAAMMLRHDQALYLVISVAAYAATLRFAARREGGKPRPGRMIVYWMAGIATPMLPVALLCLVAGAASDMIEQLIVYPLTVYAKTSAVPMPAIDSGLSAQENLVTLLFYLPPAVVILTGAWLVTRVMDRRFGLCEARVTFLTVFTGLFYCQVVTRSDMHHLLITLSPFFVLCGWWMAASAEKLRPAIAGMTVRVTHATNAGLASTAVIVLVALAAGGSYWSYVRPALMPALPQPSRAARIERGPIVLSPDGATYLEAVVAAITEHAPPDRSILVLPYQPVLYFLSQRRNPTRWLYLWKGDQGEQDHRELIDQAKADPPALILIVEPDKVRGDAPIIMDWVQREYRLADELDPISFYLPAGP